MRRLCCASSGVQVNLERRRALLPALAIAAIAAAHTAHAGATLPAGFEVTTAAGGLNKPVDIAFAPDGRIFVAEQGGVVQVVENGITRPVPFIDLQDEVNGDVHRGLLGMALDPDFATNRNVYLLYSVDVMPPSEPDFSFGRVTRYTGTLESGGNVADPASRAVLLGATAATGIPNCELSHAVGGLRFGNDGSLFVSAGDGAHSDAVDAGGLDPECFGPGGIFPDDQDIGAFRSQYLGSPAGKILRVDPATGLGLPSNPHWTGDGNDVRSRVWVNGLRNPYRFAVRPRTPGPGTLYIGDVGWSAFEEIDVATGGENFGWPCYESYIQAQGYAAVTPAHSGCDTIGGPDNPGPLTAATATWHHGNGALSIPAGLTGFCAVAGVFYDGDCYPPTYRGAFFFMDWAHDWMRVMEVDEQDALIAVHDFGTTLGRAVDLEAHPATGDLHYADRTGGEIRRIAYVGTPGDLDGDCLVGFADLLLMLSGWGDCADPPAECAGDLDGDGAVSFADLLVLLGNWS